MSSWELLTCQKFTMIATDYVEDGLPFGQRIRARFHLSWCRRCQAYLRQLKQTISAIGGLPRADAPASTREELIRRFEASHNDDSTA